MLVFTNVRSSAEQIGLRLKELLPELSDQIETHHASLDRSVRLEVEDRLKNGELRAVVCSTSLELGIDIGAVDLVVMIATPKGVSRAIQRIGRSVIAQSSTHGVLVATNVNDLVGRLLPQLVRQRALDPFAFRRSHLMSSPSTLSDCCVCRLPQRKFSRSSGRAHPFGDLSREEFDQVFCVTLKEGGESLTGVTRSLRQNQDRTRLAHRSRTTRSRAICL